MSNNDPQPEPIDLRRPRMITRLVIAAAITAGVAVGIAGIAFGNAPSGTPAAAAKTVRKPHATILHLALSATETSGSGARTSWFDEVWIGYPFGPGGIGSPGPAGFRQILEHSGISVQTGVFGRHLYSRADYIDLPGDALYDPSRNTLYELKPLYYRPPLLSAGRSQGCRDAPTFGFYVGEPATLIGGPKRWDARLQAGEIAGDAYLGGPSPRPFFSGLNSIVPSVVTPCVGEVAAELGEGEGGARRVGSTRIDGRRVIEFRGTHGSWTYYMDAHSKEPVRLVVKGVYATKSQVKPPKRERATLTLSVQSYELLPFRGNEQLLSLPAQHPGARIDTKVADYYAAQARLFPRRRWG